jgi:eukaryotic-like serine/threonine-protein kinase
VNLRERIEWVGRMAFLVFILASAAFLSAITAMRIAIHGREVAMPNLVGRNVGEASQMLRSKGLNLNVADRVYSDLPINQVVRQTPSPGMQMKVSQQAHVVLSLGQRQLEIPALEGNSLRVSRIQLLRDGLQLGEVSNYAVLGEPPDTVVIQNPKPGKGGATPRVDVLVSNGLKDPAYVMPHLLGVNEIEAQHRLDQAHLHRKINYVSLQQSEHGTVVDQSPVGGARIASTTEIELTVAN